MGHVEMLKYLLSVGDDKLNQLAKRETYPQLQAMNAIGIVNEIIVKADPRDIGNLTIVDVGCGGDGRDGCPPFFCILAGMFEANVHGIDLFEYTGGGASLYTHHEVSILSQIDSRGLLDLLSITGLQSCDVVVSNGLTGYSPSPTLLGLVNHYNNMISIDDVERAIRGGAKKYWARKDFSMKTARFITGVICRTIEREDFKRIGQTRLA